MKISTSNFQVMNEIQGQKKIIDKCIFNIDSEWGSNDVWLTCQVHDNDSNIDFNESTDFFESFTVPKKKRILFKHSKIWINEWLFLNQSLIDWTTNISKISALHVRFYSILA